MPSPLRDSVDDIQEYYRNNSEEQRFQRQQLEFLVTLQVLSHYLRSPLRILELGAGTGTYTIPLAGAGHHVTAYDFSSELIEKNRAAVKEAGLSASAEFVVADARDLAKHLGNAKFDAILVMGPLYHLVRATERKDLVVRCRQHLDKAGILITAHMSRMGFVGFLLMQHAEQILSRHSEMQEILTNGFMGSHPKDGGFRGYYTTLDEVQLLHTENQLNINAFHAQDACLMGNEFQFNAQPDPIRRAWSQFLFAQSAVPSMVFASRHFLCVSTPA